MDSNPAQLLRPGQRALAAIVFTDAVSFSARMQTDEETTLRVLKRDFATMREKAAAHEGSVLKSTGDGLLLYFPSAVQAVACALAMQRAFAGQAKSLPAPEVLVHRVGIHLGDVFVSEQDVMGDGVNIAARLQAEAEPGGICISQTVYDVVKNKLALHVTRLGPRELKNISQSIPIYRLLLEAQSLGDAEKGSVRDEPPAKDRISGKAAAWRERLAALTRSRRFRIGLLVVLALAFLFLVALQLRTGAKLRRQQAEAERARAALGEVLEESANAAARDHAELNRTGGAMRQQMQLIRQQYLDKYNFAGLALAMRKQVEDGSAPASAKVMQRAAEQMADMKEWVIGALQKHSRQSPLVVRELAGAAPKELQVYAGPDRLLYVVEGGAVRGRSWSEVKPEAVGAVIAGTILESKQQPPREVLQGALMFSRIYNMPELAEALRSRKPRGGRN